MKFLGLIQLTKRLFGALTKGEEMAKEDIVPGLVQEIQDGVKQVYSDELGKAYDAGFGDGVKSVPPSTGGGLTQADLDKAKADQQAADQAQIDSLNAQIAQDASDLAAAHADADQKASDLQAQLADMTAKDLDAEARASKVEAFKDKVDQLQGALDAIKVLLQPAPAPAPVDPQPVDPAPAA
jgi:hypothetical protein